MMNRLLANPTTNLILCILLGGVLLGLCYATGDIFTTFVAGGIYVYWFKRIEAKREDLEGSKSGSWE